MAHPVNILEELYNTHPHLKPHLKTEIQTRMLQNLDKYNVEGLNCMYLLFVIKLNEGLLKNEAIVYDELSVIWSWSYNHNRYANSESCRVFCNLANIINNDKIFNEDRRARNVVVQET